MKFDVLTNEECALPQLGEESCEGTRLPFEAGRLELRPDVAVVAVLGTVQYRTFLVANGVEREVTSGLTYRSANNQIAVVGAIGGNATGVAEGIDTISVSWQGLQAFAQLQVVSSCDNVGNGLMVLIDNSESMSQPFGAAYGSKLDFAKLLARQFIGEVDVRKDLVGLATFAVSAQIVAPLTDDNVAVGTAAAGVGFVPEETDITAGLQVAIDALTDAGVDRRVILLITDGQHNDDDEPLVLAQQFRSQGGVLIIIGLRDGPEAFVRLEKLSNGGFFISAYDGATAEDALTYVSGLKGYLCAGNCCLTGDVFSGQGTLNFDDWSNWDTTGVVDLIGNGFYDLIPGNGLFVDLVGSSSPWQGGLTTKNAFTFTTGHSYRLTYKLAGNQRVDVPGYSVRIIAGSLSNVVRDLNDWRQDFTEYSDEFTGDGSSGKLVFIQQAIPANPTAQSFGNLLDSVKLEDLTDGTLLFMDSFDGENQTYLPPGCGTGTVYGMGYGGYGYAYGYCCYGVGCLHEPIKQQNPDPNPPQDPEMPPVPSWTSTQSYTASCTTGEGADITRSATYTSLVSAADANAKALALAQAMAEADLVCVSAPQTGDLINVHALLPSDITPVNSYLKVGIAVIGYTDTDCWNLFEYNEALLKKSDCTLSMAQLRKCAVADIPGTEDTGINFPVTLDFPDVMYGFGTRFYDIDGNLAKAEAMFFDGLEEGDYEIYVYGHGNASAEGVGRYTVRTGLVTGNFASGFTFDVPSQTDYGTQDTTAVKPPTSGNYLETAWAEGTQFVKFTVTVGPGQTGIMLAVSTAVAPPGADAVCVLMGVQIQRINAAPAVLAHALAQASPGFTDELQLIWALSNSVDSYEVQQSANDGAWTAAGTATALATNLTWSTGKASGTSMRARVRSITNSVASDWSHVPFPVVLSF